MDTKVMRLHLVKVDYECPQCEDGHMRPTGICLMSFPPKYVHKCDNVNCTYTEDIVDTIYPYTTFNSPT